MSNLLAAISARKANISEVRTDIIGTLAEAPARFSALQLQVTARGLSEELERLVEVADRGCIMMNTLRGKIEVRIRTGVAM
jgi:putative redox protein